MAIPEFGRGFKSKRYIKLQYYNNNINLNIIKKLFGKIYIIKQSPSTIIRLNSYIFIIWLLRASISSRLGNNDMQIKAVNFNVVKY